MTTATTRKPPLSYPSISDFIDFVSLEWDGEDYLLCYRFPEEVHEVKVLDLEQPSDHTARLAAATLLVGLCPIQDPFRQPAARLDVAHYWARSELLTIVDITGHGRRNKRNPA